MIASTPWVDGVGHELDLPGAVGARRRADELGLGDAELAGGLDGALVGLVEHGDAGALRQQDAGEVAAASARRSPPVPRSGRRVGRRGASVAAACRGAPSQLAPSRGRVVVVVVVAAGGGDERERADER